MRRAVWLLACVLAGCAGLDLREPEEPVRFLADDFHTRVPARLAVLPFDNESTDLVAPEMLRTFVAEQLAGLGYAPVAQGPLDDALRGIGVTDGGHLRHLDPAAVGSAAGADGLVYGVVEEFAFLNVGFALRRVVRVRLKLVDAPTGRTLWEDGGQGLTERWTLNKKDAGRAFMEGLLEKAVEGIFRTPLQPEAREAVREAFRRLPARGFAVAR